MIKGVVWYKTPRVGKEKFVEIMKNYEAVKIPMIESFTPEELLGSYMKFENGDIWYFCEGKECSCGRRYNICYIDRRIDKTIIEHIIMPAANLLPYNAIRFYN